MAEKKSKYDIEYAKQNIKRIPLDVQKEHYEKIKSHAESKSESINGFIKRAINETMERDKDEQSEPEEHEFSPEFEERLKKAVQSICENGR